MVVLERRCQVGSKRKNMNGCSRPILLKTVVQGMRSRKVRARDWNLYFWQRLSDSDFTFQRAKKAFHPSMIKQFGQTDFFNRIGQKRPVTTARLHRHFQRAFLELFVVSTQHAANPPLASEPPKGVVWDRSVHIGQRALHSERFARHFVAEASRRYGAAAGLTS